MMNIPKPRDIAVWKWCPFRGLLWEYECHREQPLLTVDFVLPSEYMYEV